MAGESTSKRNTLQNLSTTGMTYQQLDPTPYSTFTCEESTDQQANCMVQSPLKESLTLVKLTVKFNWHGHSV